MEKKMGFFKKFINSITNMRSYIQFNKETLGRAFLYLLLISLIFGPLKSIRPIYDFNKGIGEIKNEINNKDIDFYFKNGEFSYSKSPYILEKDDFYFYIDTTITADKFDQSKLNSNNKSNSIYIFKDKAIINQQVNNKEEIQFKDLQGAEFNKDSVVSLINALRYIGIFIVLFLIIGVFLGHMFTALIVALLSLIINGIMKSKLEFGNLYKLAIYASTLPTIIDTIIGFTGVIIPNFYTIYLLGTLIIMGVAIKYIKDDENQQFQSLK